MDYSSVPKDDFLPSGRDPQYREATSQKRGPKKRKCCCCTCTTKRFLTICCLATVGPILLLGLIIGIYLLVQRLSYVAPPTQVSTANDTLAFLSELGISEVAIGHANATFNGTLEVQVNVTRQVVAPPPHMRFLTNILPPWTDCGSELATPRVVSMEHCELEDNRCVFKFKADWMLEIAFTTKPNVMVENPNFHACGKAIYLGTPCRAMPFSRPFPCNDSNIDCPLKGGTSYLYRNVKEAYTKEVPVKFSFDVYIDVFFRMKDPKTNKLVFCVRIPGIFKPPKS